MADEPNPAPAPPAAAAPASAPAAAAAPASQPTIAGGSDGGAAARAPPATWPDDWRQKIAGDDKDFLKTLDRFTDPSALGKSYREAQKKIGEGKSAEKLPPPADPEHLKAWRKENGIPETAKGYLEGLKFPDGRVLGDADKEIAESFAEHLHEKNVPPTAFAEAVSWYFDHREDVVAEQAEADAAYHDGSIADLKEKWGADFNRTRNAIGTLFKDDKPRDELDSLFNRIMGGRTADGHVFGDDPAVLQWLAALAIEVNPVASVINVGSGSGKGAEERMKEIEGLMRENSPKYWRDESIQAEYRGLIEAREKLQARGRAA